MDEEQFAAMIKKAENMVVPVPQYAVGDETFDMESEAECYAALMELVRLYFAEKPSSAVRTGFVKIVRRYVG